MMGVDSGSCVRTEVRQEMSESEDDISVGCPTPRPTTSQHSEMSDPEDKPRSGVRSFSILDILGHKEQQEEVTSVKPSITLRQDLLQRSMQTTQPSKIVRPWDLPQAAAYQTMLHQQQLLRHQIPFMHPFAAAALAGLVPFQMPQLPPPTAPNPSRLPAWSPASSHEEQEETEDSSSNASASPALSGEKTKASSDGKAKVGKDGSPLDALFQMTSKTFEGNGGDSSGSGSHGTMFGNRQSSNKKKRKSRTAFTNHQIFELEKRFLYQKYLSPADRDEIALSLGLTNAQVITWFQNRRAKLKRDMEELKKDVESAKLISAHSAALMHASALQHEVALMQHQKQVFDDPKKL